MLHKLHEGASPVAQLLFEREHGLPRDRSSDDVVVDQELPRTSPVLSRNSKGRRRTSGVEVQQPTRRTRVGKSLSKEKTES